MSNFQTTFEKILELRGKNVEVGIKSTAEKLSGTVTYAMFDSFIIQNEKVKKIIHFDDILFLNLVR